LEAKRSGSFQSKQTKNKALAQYTGKEKKHSATFHGPPLSIKQHKQEKSIIKKYQGKFHTKKTSIMSHFLTLTNKNNSLKETMNQSTKTTA
jgi:hypothetical protein